MNRKRTVKNILEKSEKTRIFYVFGIKQRIFYVLQLVCEGHLRSSVGKTYVRLWNTLACASGGDDSARLKG